MSFERNVFVNCPFDNEYYPLLKSILFTVVYLGFEPKISETDDSGTARLNKLVKLAKQSKFSIHDISRKQLNHNNLPRFNMPFECGIDFGVKLAAAKGKLTTKVCLILDDKPYEYQQFMSDISGNDISAHHNEAEKLIKAVRNFLNLNTNKNLAMPKTIFSEFVEFNNDHVVKMRKQGLNPTDIYEIQFTDLIAFMKAWLSVRN